MELGAFPNPNPKDILDVVLVVLSKECVHSLPHQPQHEQPSLLGELRHIRLSPVTYLLIECTAAHAFSFARVSSK